MSDINDNVEQSNQQRANMLNFDRAMFQKLIISDLQRDKNSKAFLKKYKQSEVREILENYKLPKNQEKLVEISRMLYAKSPQYQRLLKYFSGMLLFPYIITPIKDIRKLNKSKVSKQYADIGEFAKMMNIKHEMNKVLQTAFVEDVFYGYVYKTSKDFYIQKLDYRICKITSVEDGVYNFSIDMGFFEKNEDDLVNWADEIRIKYYQWKAIKGKGSKISSWVELDAKNTICIKINEDILETFPPFAGSFDAIFDIEGFKQLRKDREEIQNYMLITQELPIREDSENNNDFMIDQDMMMFFHNMASETVPQNVGVITSPMPIKPIKFDKDTANSDGVANAERDFWAGSGTSQILFSSSTNTSQGVLSSIKTDEEIAFTVLNQVNRWLNRYLKFNFKDLMFNINVLNITHFNKQETFDMYLQAGQYGVPVKSHICAVVGLEPVEMMGMAYLENDLLALHEEFIPLISSHTQSGDTATSDSKTGGTPKKDANKISDEGQKARDKKQV